MSDTSPIFSVQARGFVMSTDLPRNIASDFVGHSNRALGLHGYDIDDLQPEQRWQVVTSSSEAITEIGKKPRRIDISFRSPVRDLKQGLQELKSIFKLFKQAGLSFDKNSGATVNVGFIEDNLAHIRWLKSVLPDYVYNQRHFDPAGEVITPEKHAKIAGQIADCTHPDKAIAVINKEVKSPIGYLVFTHTPLKPLPRFGVTLDIPLAEPKKSRPLLLVFPEITGSLTIENIILRASKAGQLLLMSRQGVNAEKIYGTLVDLETNPDEAFFASATPTTNAKEPTPKRKTRTARGVTAKSPGPTSPQGGEMGPKLL